MLKTTVDKFISINNAKVKVMRDQELEVKPEDLELFKANEFFKELQIKFDLWK